jgi:hypothetical protein
VTAEQHDTDAAGRVKAYLDALDPTPADDNWIEESWTARPDGIGRDYHELRVGDLRDVLRQLDELRASPNIRAIIELAREHAQATARVAMLERLVSDMLARFTDHGHPGVGCVRTPWLERETVTEWRKRAYRDAGTSFAADPAQQPQDGPHEGRMGAPEETESRSLT